MLHSELERRSLARAQLMARAPRWALFVTTAVLCIAGVRSITRGTPTAVKAANQPAPAASSLHLDGFAEAFARAYLTFDSGRPQDRAAALEPFIAPGMNDRATVGLPLQGERTVTWTSSLGRR